MNSEELTEFLDYENPEHDFFKNPYAWCTRWDLLEENLLLDRAEFEIDNVKFKLISASLEGEESTPYQFKKDFYQQDRIGAIILQVNDNLFRVPFNYNSWGESGRLGDTYGEKIVEVKRVEGVVIKWTPINENN